MADEDDNRNSDENPPIPSREGNEDFSVGETQDSVHTESSEGKSASRQVEVNLNPDFFVEFQLSSIEKRYNRQEMQDLLYDLLPSIVPEKNILGVQLLPWFAPRRVEIQCVDKITVETLVLNGLTIDGHYVELSEQGYGALRVTIQDVPMNVPNAILRDWLAQYGEVIDIHDETYTNRKKGKRTNWKVGARVAKLKLFSFDRTVPPRAFLTYNNRRFNMSVHHFGQSEMYCRTCRDIVKKEHECSRDRQRKCFKCNSTGHMKADCPQGKTCHTCKGIGHFSNNCPKNNLNFSERSEFPDMNQDTLERPNKTNSGQNDQIPSSGHKRTASSLNSPERSEIQPQTAAVQVHTDNEGFTFDRHQRKKIMRATRKGTKSSATPSTSTKASDNIEVISSDVRVSPIKKKLRTGQMKIVNLWNKISGKEETKETSEETDSENEGTLQEEETGKNSAEEKKKSSTKPKKNTKKSPEANPPSNKDKGAGKKSKTKEGKSDTSEAGEKQIKTTKADQPCCKLHTHQTSLYTIGASNFVDAKIVGDEDLQIQHKNFSHGGLNILLSPSKLNNMHEEERQNIPLLVTNVGSVDFLEEGGNDTKRIYNEYADTVIKLKTLCPKAEIIVSSIIPRRGEDRFSKVNADIAKVNAMLKTTCDESTDRVHFCDNTEVVIDESHQVKNHLYEDYIHLNPAGRRDLCKSIFKKTKEIYFARHVCQVCAKILCASSDCEMAVCASPECKVAGHNSHA